MREIIDFYGQNSWMYGVTLAAIIVLIVTIVVLVKRAKSGKRASEKEQKMLADQAAAKEEAARIREEEAAKAFVERRSVDLDVVESNRRVEGASAVTGKKNY